MTFKNEHESEFWLQVFRHWTFNLNMEPEYCAEKADKAVELHRERAAELEKVKNMEALGRKLAGGEA